MSKKFLPHPIMEWMYDHECWLVSSGVDWVLSHEDTPRPADFDVLVPQHKWNTVLRTVHGMEAKVNTFGGIKVQIKDDLSADIWPGTVDEYLDMSSSYQRYVRLLRLRPALLVEGKHLSPGSNPGFRTKDDDGLPPDFAEQLTAAMAVAVEREKERHEKLEKERQRNSASIFRESDKFKCVLCGHRMSDHKDGCGCLICGAPC